MQKLNFSELCAWLHQKAFGLWPPCFLAPAELLVLKCVISSWAWVLAIISSITFPTSINMACFLVAPTGRHWGSVSSLRLKYQFCPYISCVHSSYFTALGKYDGIDTVIEVLTMEAWLRGIHSKQLCCFHLFHRCCVFTGILGVGHDL